METPPVVPRVVGRYALYDPIASGGMATVHLGRLHGPVGFSRTVAIKRMHPQLAGDPDFVSMFLDEARIVARISHPNVVPTLDVVATGGELLIVMEYVRGESLFTLLRTAAKKGMRLPPALIAAVIVGVLHGLHAAHEARSEAGHLLGIVHRDVSPQNILVGIDGIPRVLDFGIAKAAVRLATTREGELKGKLSYMAPEQLGGHVTRASDVYAAAVVLWEALAGHRLFSGDNEVQTIDRILEGCKTPPSHYAPDVLAALDRVTMRGLSVDPAARYPTAREMALAIEGTAVGFMRASQIGEWVQSVAKDSLERRSALVAALESDTSVPDVTDKASLMTVREPSPALARRKPWRWALAALPVAGVGLGVAAAYLAVRATHHTETPVVHAAASGTATRVTVLTDLPPPATSVPGAAAEYAAGIQSLRDNSWDLAARHFERAVEADPTLAAGHLRLAMVEETNPARKREEFAKAASLHGQLSPRDQVLLEALEPVLRRARVDRPEALSRLEAAHAKYPFDVEFLDWMATLRENDPTGALARSEQAIALDPSDGDAWQTKAYSLALLQRNDEARAAYERCAKLSVNSVDCFLDLAWLDALQGKSDQYETDARRLLDRSPIDYAPLAQALFTRGRPLPAVQEVLDQGLLHEEEPDRALGRLVQKRAFALVTGDFAQAEDVARRAVAAARSSTKRDDLAIELGMANGLVEVLEEEGHDDEAQRVSYDVASRSEAWTSSNATSGWWDLSFLFLRRAVGRGGSTLDDFARKRSADVEERLKSLSAYPGLLWGFAYAAPATTAEEAQQALEVLPNFAPLTSLVAGGMPDADAQAGRAYLLAGKPSEALPYLKRAVANCNALLSLIVHTRAALNLGLALEATDDKVDACSAYKIVLDRWAHARPRSLTGEKAKERFRALACKR